MTTGSDARQPPPEAGQIGRILELMGGTPDHVAATMRGARIKGLRDSTSFMNPVVRYLNHNLELGARLEVGADGTALRMLHKGKIQELKLPAPVKEFLERFHRGLYPELEAEQSP
jgi:hypothetical protein